MCQRAERQWGGREWPCSIGAQVSGVPLMDSLPISPRETTTAADRTRQQYRAVTPLAFILPTSSFSLCRRLPDSYQNNRASSTRTLIGLKPFIAIIINGHGSEWKQACKLYTRSINEKRESIFIDKDCLLPLLIQLADFGQQGKVGARRVDNMP